MNRRSFFGTIGDLLVQVRKEKQNRTGKGRTIAIPDSTGPGCAVAALECWLAVRGDTDRTGVAYWIC
jgi:hypothetical protein